MTTSDLLALKVATIAAAADLWQKAAWRFFFRLGELKGSRRSEGYELEIDTELSEIRHDL